MNPPAHRHRSNSGPSAGGGLEVVGGDAGDPGVGDAAHTQFVQRCGDVRLRPRGEPAARRARRHQRDVGVRERLRHLGGELEAGQAATADDDPGPRVGPQRGGDRQRRLGARHRMGVLGHAGHARDIDRAACGVEQRVVGQRRAFGERERVVDEPLDPSDAQPHAGGKESGERQVRAWLTGRELVQARPFDEAVPCRHENQLHVVSIGLPGDPVDGGQPRVARAQHNDAMHDRQTAAAGCG